MRRLHLPQPTNLATSHCWAPHHLLRTRYENNMEDPQQIGTWTQAGGVVLQPETETETETATASKDEL